MTTDQRYSRKREAIRQELTRSKDHPGAETLYARLKPQFPDLSLGTVYRNLTAFLEERQILRVATVDGVERFDADLHPHAHFVCEKCGSVTDVEYALPPENVPSELPGVLRTYAITYYGVCHRCQSSQEE